MPLPATYDAALEAEAVAFARAQIAAFNDNPVPMFGIDVRCLDEGDNRRFARHSVKLHALTHPLNLMKIADYARAGWGLADEALRELIVEFLDRGEPMPTYLAAYNMELAAGSFRHPPGPRKEDKFVRSVALVVIVEMVAGKFALRPTRNRTSKRPSACSVVAQAAGLSAPAVVAMWQRFGEQACIDYHRRRPL